MKHNFNKLLLTNFWSWLIKDYSTVSKCAVSMLLPCEATHLSRTGLSLCHPRTCRPTMCTRCSQQISYNNLVWCRKAGFRTEYM